MGNEWLVLLTALWVSCLLCSWTVSGAAIPPRPCSPPRGYGRFHANDSIIGRPVPCTREDKICFRYNLLFDPELDRCEPVGGGRHGMCDLRPNRTEFEHGSGRLIGACKTYEDPCPGHRMAYDGRCYRKEVVRDVICGCDVQPTPHILGGEECHYCLEPIDVQQPKEDTLCRIPDVRFPDTQRNKFFANPMKSIQGFRGDRTGISFKEQTPNLTCEFQQAECFSQEKVWVSEYKGCHSLLEQGPCPDGHVVALDSQAAFQGRAVATCVHVRGGCPRDYRRMLFDGQCHEDRELNVSSPGLIVWNQYGQYVIIPHNFGVGFKPKNLDKDSCKVDIYGIGSTTADYVRKPPCNDNKRELCHLYDVETEIPKPKDDSSLKIKQCKQKS